MTIFTDNLVSWICTESFDLLSGTVKNKISDKRDISKLEKELREFIKIEQTEFYTVDFGSEFDFQGLSDFILNNMTNELKIFLFGNIQQRESAKNTIISKAIEKSSASSSSAQEKVRTIIKQSLQIISDFFANKIDPLTQINSNVIVDKIKNITDNQNNEIIECINNKFEKVTNANMFTERMKVLKSINSIALPDFELDIIPKRKSYNNEEISESELSILFSDSFLNYYKKLREHISFMDRLISDLLTFYSLSRKPDGEGSYENKTWDKILEFEKHLILPNDTDDKKKEFEVFCRNNTFIKNTSEAGENKEYNYFDIQQEMKNVKSLFDNTKKEMIFQMNKYILQN